MEILWDEPKRASTLSKRGLDLAMLTVAFFEGAKVVRGKKDRLIAIGLIEGVAYAVVYKPLRQGGPLDRHHAARQQEGKADPMKKAAKTIKGTAAVTPTKEAARDAARGFTDADLAEIADFPELTDAELATARPFAEVCPDLAASIRRTRGPQKAPTKKQVTLRLDQDVIDRFKAAGKGWQVRMGDALRKASGV